ncbi:DUF3558 domain-containing protein [Tomitella fengzijianii]|nr:DUF3558 domain-containing protein [Tomitella fengzijianii]
MRADPPRARRPRRPARVAGLLACCVLAAGCAQTVRGEASVAEPSGGSAEQQYVNLLRECTVVPEDVIADTAGVQAVVDTFSGAVCRWRSFDGATDVQLNWFESGTMDREKSVAERLGYTVETVRISGAPAYVMRAPDDASSCGAVARAGDSGVVGWWVHGAPVDPCAAARTLVELSINRAL